MVTNARDYKEREENSINLENYNNYQLRKANKAYMFFIGMAISLGVTLGLIMDACK